MAIERWESMLTQAEYKALAEKLDRLTEEVEGLRQAFLSSRPRHTERSDEAWNNLLELSKKISANWQGPSAAEEIRAQRDKGY
jgi:uncharacterized protein YlxW (UPF0749 family)